MDRLSAIIITIMRRGRFMRLVSVLMLAFTLSALAPVAASSANISHSYQTSSKLKEGSLVSLDSKRSDHVQAANVSNGSRLLGVVVTKDDSLIAVDAGPGTIQVATNGTANALVSTLNGDIRTGDQVEVSPFDGIGVKAQPGSHVIGLAQTDFNSASQGVDRKVTDKYHRSHDIRVGYARVSIAVGVSAGGSDSLTGLQRLARSITGHTVSNVRVISSLVVVAVSLLALVTLVYASIYGSIVSVGRNPLAKYSVFRTLTSVLVMAVLTTMVAAVTVFFLLR